MLTNLDLSDLEPLSVEVKYGGKTYMLREGSADAVAKFKNRGISMAKWDTSGKLAGMGAVADLEPYLVSLCLWQADQNGKETLVQEAVIRGWPSRVVTRLYNWAKEASMIEDQDTEESLAKRIEEDQKKLEEIKKRKALLEETDEVKNSSGGTPDTSV